jgi:catechol 2,3-dioxygenase-like lactoylglutathione lyase family enzyme
MPIALDHLIVHVNDAAETVEFWTRILGLTGEGETGPFSVVRVSETLTVQFAPWGTDGNEHFAFSFSPEEFEDAFARIRDSGIPYGDTFHDVGNMRGPGEEFGARGNGKTVYFCDPNKHLLEIRTYSEGGSRQ